MKLACVLVFCLGAALARVEDWSWSSMDDLETYPTTCQVFGRKLVTYDNVKLPIPLPTCHTILAKDCSPVPKFVVMMRKLNENSDLKEVKIITRTHKIVLIPSEYHNQIRLIVNGQERPLIKYETELTVRGFPVIRILKERTQQVRVELLTQGLKVRFDGYTCDVKLPETSFNKKCGLCGISSKIPMELLNNFQTGFSTEFPTEFGTMNTEVVRRLVKKYITNDCRQHQMYETSNMYDYLFNPMTKYETDEFTTYNPYQTSRLHESEHLMSGLNTRFQQYGYPEHEEMTSIFNTPFEHNMQENTLFENTMYQNTPFENTMHQSTPFENTLYQNTPLENTMYRNTPFENTIYQNTPYTHSSQLFDDETTEDNEYDTFFGKRGVTGRQQRRPLLKHKKVERGNEVCISLERIPQCPFTTYPVQKVEKRVPYKCVNRNNPIVMRLQQKIRTGEVIPEIQHLQYLTPSMTRTEVVPTKCVPVY